MEYCKVKAPTGEILERISDAITTLCYFLFALPLGHHHIHRPNSIFDRQFIESNFFSGDSRADSHATQS